ncbi:hypothetical protein BH11MYX1_BH11MYX1_34330 [soil metagenome]
MYHDVIHVKMNLRTLATGARFAAPTGMKRVAFALLGFVACTKDKPEQRAEKAVEKADFWPEALKPRTTKAPAKLLAYQPANITNYVVKIDAHTTPDAAASVSAVMSLTLGFKPATSATSRDAYIRAIDMVTQAQGQGMKMTLGNEQLVVTDKGETTTLKRGDAGPMDVGKMLDLPFTTIDFARGHVSNVGNPAHPFTAIGTNFLDDAMVLFPDLPAEPIEPGHTWKMVRTVSVGGSLGQTEVTYNFTYDGDGACPTSSTASCADLSFSASSPGITLSKEGATFTAKYGFAGKVYLDLARGTVDESRVHMDMDIKGEGLSLPMVGTFVIKPT